jgi:hypothetical protein
MLDGKWHRVKIKVRPPQELRRVFVRNREGYSAVGRHGEKATLGQPFPKGIVERR